MKVEVTHNVADLISSLKVWDNKPILDVYFDDKENIEQELIILRKSSIIVPSQDVN